MAAFVRNLAAAFEALPGDNSISYACLGEGWPELSGDVKEFGARSSIEEYRVDGLQIGKWCEEANVDFLLCPGNQASRTNHKTLWWPLTVAPFEQIALNELARGVKGRARWSAVRKSLDVSARFSDAVIFSSNYARALYDAGLTEGLAQKPTAVIRPATSIEITRNTPTDPPYLLSVSNFNRYKFLVEILEGFAGSVNREQGWSIRLAGRFPDPDYEKVVRQTIVELGIGEAVDLVGEQTPDELVPLYRDASAFVFASVSENAASYTVIDALAYGLPVVSSFYSSTPEILGNAVLYADPFSHADIASALSRLADPANAQLLGAAALERAASFPSWDNIAAELVEFAQDI